jgi:hypothetical protein
MLPIKIQEVFIAMVACSIPQYSSLKRYEIEITVGLLINLEGEDNKKNIFCFVITNLNLEYA